MIKLIDASKNILGESIFTHINLSIAKGEFLIIIGKSGEGKSTLLSILAIEDCLSQGSLLINKEVMEFENSAQKNRVKRKIGRIFQDYKLIADLTVAENIAYPLECRGDLDKIEIKKRIHESLSEIGILNIAHEFPETISGGEQQRVAIARCLAQQSYLIVADEPTSNLDPDNSKKIFEILSIIAKKGIPVIVATHDLQNLKEYPTRVLELSGGELIEHIH